MSLHYNNNMSIINICIRLIMYKLDGFKRTLKGRYMISTIIKDDNGYNYHIKDIKSFYQHILDYHTTGTSLHEENGHYFTVNEEFRSKVKKLYQNNN